MIDAATAALRELTGGLVVSCQARPDNPFHGPEMMARMAEAAVRGGAIGIRANGATDITAIRSVVSVPIIGIAKVTDTAGNVTITPTPEAARSVIASGAQLVAFDGTPRPRADNASVAAVIAAIHAAGGIALADVATLEGGLFAESCGADAVGTTLSGYATDSPRHDEPDFRLLQA
ncbi:MAG: putative N-acetylmannosamine-6-phosphate 2-epimerase, partial [Chloroflexota bacterium]|nr:putative N-acetylmannosamine-6-phosphate 2-epimerase [Chloroflexota bacterium]